MKSNTKGKKLVTVAHDLKQLAQAVAAPSSESKAPAPEVIQRVAVSRGAKTGSDKVSVSVDIEAAAEKIAKMEAGIIVQQVNLLGSRVEQWQAVAKLAEANPKVLEIYPGKLSRELLVMGGLTLREDGTLPDRKLWPEDFKKFYTSVISKQISYTRRAMDALKTNFTQARLIIDGKGTIMQKLAALPARASTGRKPQAPKAPDTGSTSGTQHAVAKAIKEFTSAQLVESCNIIVAHGKQRKEFITSPAYQRFLVTVEAAVRQYDVDVVKETDKSGSMVKAEQVRTATGTK